MNKLIQRIFLGQPLATRAMAEEKLNNFQALAIFGSDAISSSVYASEEVLLGLMIAGTILFSASLSVALAISALIIIVTLSYREIVHAYPQGGGVYNVAKQNLGEFPSLLGASSLLIDYVLTVAVSITAGVAAITSAFPSLFTYRVILGIGVILFLMWMNLRGVRSAGRIFSFPTYFFIISMIIMLGTGLFRFFQGTLPAISSQGNPLEPIGLIGIFILLKAFSSGCAALTGIEAISNGIRAFKPPESYNAAKTLFRLASLLILIFLGIMFLAYQIHVIPLQEQTVVSQIARALFEGNPFYFIVQIATFLILFLAANTPYADFPRVIALLAGSEYFPKQFFALGSRLVFSRGIVFLSIISGILLFIFKGSTHALIPLYAVGVFLGFSLSQLGMVFHWKKEGIRNHLKSIIVNSVGFLVTLTVFFVVLVEKFSHGAWILLPTVSILILLMKRIKGHYVATEKTLEIKKDQLAGTSLKEIMMVVLVSKIDRRTIEATYFATSFNLTTLRAFHVAFAKSAGDELKKEWEKLFPNIPIEIRTDELRETIPSILDYFASLEEQWKGKIVAIVPMVVPKNYFAEYLHNQEARKIIEAIRKDPRNNVEILEVPIKI